MPLPRALALLPASALVLAALTGCEQKSTTSGASGNAVTVTASDTDCSLSSTSVASGATTFTVKNTGTKVTEFYVQAGRTVVGEVENVAPGITRSLSMTLKRGTYTTLCKPGETGSGVGRSTLTVTGAGAAPADIRSQQASVQTA